MIKQYPITFRDDFNGRPKIYIMSDNTKFLIVHPFYSFDSNNYGRYYTYYSLDEKFNMDNEIEIWTIDSGTFCIEKCWSEFKKSFLELPNVFSDVKIKIDTTDFLVRRIPMEDFKPDLLGTQTDIMDYINSKNDAPAKEVRGYVKIGAETFAIICVDWHGNDDGYASNSDDDKYIYSGYDVKLDTKYRKYKKGYDEPLIISKQSNLNYAGTVYGLPDKGILLYLNTNLD